MEYTVKGLNDTVFAPRGLRLKFRIKFLRTSWFEIWRESASEMFETVVTDASMETVDMFN
jgi:hypothetical protein